MGDSFAGWRGGFVLRQVAHDHPCAPEHLSAASLPQTPVLAVEPINPRRFDIEQETEFMRPIRKLSTRASSTDVYDEHDSMEAIRMSKEEDNKAVVGRWFTHFWGKTCDLAIVDEL